MSIKMSINGRREKPLDLLVFQPSNTPYSVRCLPTLFGFLVRLKHRLRPLVDEASGDIAATNAKGNGHGHGQGTERLRMDVVALLVLGSLALNGRNEDHSPQGD